MDIMTLCENVLNELNNVKYNVNKHDKDICIVMPNKLLKVGQGTCWDQSLYVWYKLKNSVEDIKVLFFWWYNQDNSAQSHTCVIVKDKNNWLWIEPAYQKYRGIHIASSKEELQTKIIKCLTKRPMSFCNFDCNYNKVIKMSKNGILDEHTFLNILFKK